MTHAGIQGESGERHGRPRGVAAVALLVAGALQLVVGYFTVAAIGLIAVPMWAIVILAGLWLAAAVLVVVTARRRPLLAPLAPVANGLLLWGSVAVGEGWLGWMA
jgi:hypothetical protein